jgi:hypothetical protein
MEAHFSGVSLGAGLAEAQTWAHDLDVSIGENGITVGGTETAPSSTVPWSAVKHFAPGFTLVFPDGRPATELEVRLADRDLNFLVPAEQLPPELVAQLLRIAPESTARPDPRKPWIPKDSTLVASNGKAAGRTARRKSDGGGRNGKRLLVAVVGVAVVVAVVLGVTLGSGASTKTAGKTTTTTTRATTAKTTPTTISPVPIHELTGPADSVQPQAALTEVLIRSKDLHGWKEAYGNTDDVPGAPQADADTSFDPFVPSAASVVEPSFGVLQQCSNLALTHIQLLTGNYYAGGPPTWNSATFYPSDENLTQQTVTPQLYSIASLVSSLADQKSDFAAMASPGFASCLSSFFSSYLRATFSEQGYTVDDLSVRAEPVATIPGVETLEFVLTGQLIEAGDVFGFRNTVVFIGAGRIEQMVSGYDSIDQPIPSGTWRILLVHLQRRMKVVASLR